MDDSTVRSEIAEFVASVDPGRWREAAEGLAEWLRGELDGCWDAESVRRVSDRLDRLRRNWAEIQSRRRMGHFSRRI